METANPALLKPDPSSPVPSSRVPAISTDVSRLSVAELREYVVSVHNQIDALVLAVDGVATGACELDHLAAGVEELSHQVGRLQVKAAVRMESVVQELKDSQTFTPRRSRFRSAADRLSQVLHVNPAEVQKRLDVAHAVSEAVAPAVADAFAQGLLTVGVAARIMSALERLQPAIDQLSPTREEAEALKRKVESDLVGIAVSGTPTAMERQVRVWQYQLDAQGVLPTREVKREIQGAFFKGKKMGLFEWTFCLDELQQEQFLTAVAPEVNPRTPDHDGREPLLDFAGVEVPRAMDENGKPVEPPKDDRSLGQKRLDGLMHAVTTALSTGKLSRHGGYQPQVVVNIDHKTLLSELTTHELFRSDAVHSGPMNPISIRQLGCNAELIPVVLGSASQVVDAGSRKRLFTAEQRKLLYARDRGCTFPGCTRGVDRCEAHHVHEYSKGGVTTLENAAMVCSHHHHLVHETPWSIQMRNGVPYWQPPLDEDPNQPLMRNLYFHPEKAGQLALSA
ncbi:HNH endonuclease signature motif containing protein [Neomicrococcus lactis]|uniref:HNH nuclease domain-containing protein n=1 Tax=Neomicrococcus lactis TaxID=732241 RepID=A0A7W9DBN7_9MICC|nr:HNH endonuclease signature motif containing protein [Neomicrococcus lactis]MBB5598835.1 hypothetical protein [Neomicrococcus lactis]